MRLLLVEDELRLAASLKRGLSEEGFQVDHAADGRSGEEMATDAEYDVMIVDWRLPYQDGPTLIRHLRDAGNGIPILMLTALGDVENRVTGLGAGADDYLTKPFSFEELLARLHALLRRPAYAPLESRLAIGGLILDTRKRSAKMGEANLNLRPKEYLLLELFLRRQGEVLTRTAIAERVWDDPFGPTDNVLDVTISGLRQKLADAQTVHDEGIRLQTVRGAGYRLVIDHQS